MNKEMRGWKFHVAAERAIAAKEKRIRITGLASILESFGRAPSPSLRKGMHCMRRRIATVAALLTSFCLLTACEKTPAVSNPSSIGGESVNSMGQTTGALDLEALLDKETELLKRVNNTDSYQSLITTPVDINIFVDTFDSNPFNAFNGQVVHISQVAEAIGLECLRQKPDGTLYSVHKVSQGGLLYIFYDTYQYQQSEKTDMRTWYYVKKPLSYSDFQGIKEGADLKKVKKVDPAAGVYIDRLNRFGGVKEGTLLSDHYLRDGILRYGYEKVNGRFVIVGMRFDPDFRAHSYGSAREKIIDGQVYPMDREGL